MLGLFREEEGLAARVLASFDITIEDVRAKVVAVDPGEDDGISGQIPFTPVAKNVLELALREALSLGHNYVGTEHILLGLVRKEAGLGNKILHELLGDNWAWDIRNKVIEMLSGRQNLIHTNNPADDHEHDLAGSDPKVAWELRVTSSEHFGQHAVIAEFLAKPTVNPGDIEGYDIYSGNDDDPVVHAPNGCLFSVVKVRS